MSLLTKSFKFAIQTETIGNFLRDEILGIKVHRRKRLEIVSWRFICMGRIWSTEIYAKLLPYEMSNWLTLGLSHSKYRVLHEHWLMFGRPGNRPMLDRGVARTLVGPPWNTYYCCIAVDHCRTAVEHVLWLCWSGRLLYCRGACTRVILPWNIVVLPWSTYCGYAEVEHCCTAVEHVLWLYCPVILLYGRGARTMVILPWNTDFCWIASERRLI